MSQKAVNSAAKDGAVNKVECGARCPEEPSDGPDWSRLKGEVIERIDALAAIHDKLDAPPEWRAKLWNDLALPNLRLLAEFCTNITLNDEDEDSEVVS